MINKDNLIIGKNSVLEAIKNKVEIEELYISNKIFIKTNIKKNILSNEEMNKITDLNHQGYIALIKPFNYSNFEEISKPQNEIILILDHIEDPNNLGAIIRSANAFNISNIIIPNKRAAKITPTVFKVASGGMVNTKIHLSNSLVNSVSKLKDKGFWIYSSILDTKSKEINNANFNFPMALIIGNEGKGISSSLQKMSHESIFIKTSGTVQSLNASCASSIFFYEITRKKNNG